MPVNGLLAGTDGQIGLPGGLTTLKVTDFKLRRTDKEEDTTLMGDQQESGTFVGYRFMGTVAALVPPGGLDLSQTYQNANCQFVFDPNDPQGQVSGPFNLTDFEVVAEREKVTAVTFTAKSQKGIIFGTAS